MKKSRKAYLSSGQALSKKGLTRALERSIDDLRQECSQEIDRLETLQATHKSLEGRVKSMQQEKRLLDDRKIAVEESETRLALDSDAHRRRVERDLRFISEKRQLASIVFNTAQDRIRKSEQIEEKANRILFEANARKANIEKEVNETVERRWIEFQEKIRKEKEVKMKRLKSARSTRAAVTSVILLLLSTSAFATSFDEDTVLYKDEFTTEEFDGNWIFQNSIELSELSEDPATPSTAAIKLFTKDNVGLTSLYSMSDAGTVSEIISGPNGVAPLSEGGTGTSLTDPNADRIFFWDDSAGASDWLTIGTGLSISGTTLSVTAGGGWTDGGTDVTLSTTTDEVVVGTGASIGKLSVTGDTDQIQVNIKGNGTQTNPLLLVENSAGTDILSVTTAGFTATGSGSGNFSVGNGATGPGILRILEDTDAGSNYTDIQVPAMSANITLTLPADDGDTDQVLSTNGSGVLDWVAASGTTTWDAIGDSAADGSIAQGGHEQDITSTLDEVGSYILTITNTDDDSANATGFLSFVHDDIADADVIYEKFISDADGTPTTDWQMTQTAITTTLPITVTGGTGFTTTGTILSTNTGSMGWTAVDQTDNQACNTGCTSACVFGVENATGTAVTGIVSCDATTADTCMCAGAS